MLHYMCILICVVTTKTLQTSFNTNLIYCKKYKQTKNSLESVIIMENFLPIFNITIFYFKNLTCDNFDLAERLGEGPP